MKALSISTVLCPPAVMLALVAPATAQSPKIGDPPEAHDMRLVGMNDLQARSAYQPRRSLTALRSST
jgi:hypothetical protein